MRVADGRGRRARGLFGVLPFTALTLALTACGGGSMTLTGTTTATGQSVSVPPPAISGTPPASVTAGTGYSFTPTTTDPSGKTLSFSITNKPGWANFSIATGQLSGTPAGTQTGTYSNIVLSVSDGVATSSLPPFSIAVTPATSTTGNASFSGTWFASNSVWNTPIPANVVIEPNSAAIMSHYVSAYGGMWGFSVSTDTWTPAVIEAPATTPTSSVTFTQVGTWTISKIPVTSEVFAAVDYFKSKGDTDSSICLYSDADGVFFNFWAFYDAGGGTFTVGTGAIFPINGPGWWNNSAAPWAGAAAGGSYCGGLIRPSEWAAGQINHALQGAFPSALNLTGSVNGFIFPATTSDGAGTNTAQDLPEGALLQLDPTLTDAQLLAMGVPSADLPICHALQIYGWYNNDSTANTFPATIRFQSALGQGSTLYPGAANLPISIFNHMRWVAPPSSSSVPPNDSHTSASAYMVSP